VLITIVFSTAGAKEKPPSTRAWLPALEQDQAYLYLNRSLPMIHRRATANFKYSKPHSVSFTIKKKKKFVDI